MAKQGHFSRQLFQFLSDLAANNDKAWFEANRGRYEDHVRVPLLRFISDFGPYLRKVSPHFVADPRPVGGSMFRIHRDTRFSKDKRPYKTAATAQFRHAAGKDVHAPGFYVHLEPGRVFVGMGLWRPAAGPLAMVRAAISEDGPRWRRATRTKAFTDHFTLEGDSLKRPPKGVDPEDPLLVDLKRKDFIVTVAMRDADALRADFIGRVSETFFRGSAFMEFLTRAVDLPY